MRREGNSFTLLVCPHLGGYPYPIMLCNITQNPMGQTPGGVPISHNACNITQNSMRQTPEGVGYPARGVPCLGVPCQGGGYSAWEYPAKGVLCQGVPWGGTLPGVPCWGDPIGGYPAEKGGGTLPGGHPVRTTEGVLTTRRAVCLLRSRRRTFLLKVLYSLTWLTWH